MYRMQPAHVPVPYALDETTTSLLPALSAGATPVISVALTACRSISSLPPIVTLFTPEGFLPVIVTFVPPASGPVAGITESTIGAGAGLVESEQPASRTEPSRATMLRETLMTPSGGPSELKSRRDLTPLVFEEPPVGFEPTTARLRIESSTTELRWRGVAITTYSIGREVYAVVPMVVPKPTPRSASRRPPNLAACCSIRYSTASERWRTWPRCPYTLRTIASPPWPISRATVYVLTGAPASSVWRRAAQYVCRNIFERISPSFQPARMAIASSSFRKSVSIASSPVR